MHGPHGPHGPPHGPHGPHGHYPHGPHGPHGHHPHGPHGPHGPEEAQYTYNYQDGQYYPPQGEYDYYYYQDDEYNSPYNQDYNSQEGQGYYSQGDINPQVIPPQQMPIEPPPQQHPFNPSNQQIPLNPPSQQPPNNPVPLQPITNNQPGYNQQPNFSPQQQAIPDSIHEHPLNYVPALNVLCTICQQSDGGQPGYKCGQCGVSLCLNCSKRVFYGEKKTTLHPHPLALKFRNSWRCNICNILYKNTSSFFCNECDFDICASCYVPY